MFTERSLIVWFQAAKEERRAEAEAKKEAQAEAKVRNI
jgi:hypothetical protein